MEVCCVFNGDPLENTAGLCGNVYFNLYCFAGKQDVHKVIAQCLVGDVLGTTGQNLVRVCIQMTVLGMGIAAAFLIGIFININLVFPILLIYSMIVTVAVGVIASLRFDSMEQLA